jgi:hypothetical protein
MPHKGFFSKKNLTIAIKTLTICYFIKVSKIYCDPLKTLVSLIKMHV